MGCGSVIMISSVPPLSSRYGVSNVILSDILKPPSKETMKGNECFFCCTVEPLKRALCIKDTFQCSDLHGEAFSGLWVRRGGGGGGGGMMGG